MRDGRFILVGLELCELDSDRTKGRDWRSVENRWDKGVVGAVTDPIPGKETGGWVAG